MVGGSKLGVDTTTNLLAKRIWERVGSPPTWTEHVGIINSHDGEIEVQTKTRLTVVFPGMGPRELEFGIVDDVKTGLHCDAYLKSDILSEVNPQSYPVCAQAIVLEGSGILEDRCLVCLSSIDGQHVLHCGGTTRPAHVSCFGNALSAAVPVMEGGILLWHSVCGHCQCPSSKPIEKPSIPDWVIAAVSQFWPAARVLSHHSHGGKECEMKVLNPDVRSMAIRMAQEDRQAKRLRNVARALDLFEEITTRTQIGANLLPKTLATDVNQDGTIRYLLTSLVPPTGQLTRINQILTLHGKERAPTGTFSFLPSESNDGSFSLLPSDHMGSIYKARDPKWSSFLRQWILSIQKCPRHERHQERVSSFVEHITTLIGKLVEL